MPQGNRTPTVRLEGGHATIDISGTAGVSRRRFELRYSRFVGDLVSTTLETKCLLEARARATESNGDILLWMEGMLPLHHSHRIG